MAYVKGKSGTIDLKGINGFTMRIKWSETYDLEKNKSIISIDGMQIQSTTYGGTFYLGGDAPAYGTVKVDGVLLRTMNYNGNTTHSVTVNAGTSWWDVQAINTGYHDDNKFPWVTGEIAHDADGSKKASIEANLKLWRSSTGAIMGWHNTTGTIDLTTIPRASTATVPNFTIGSKGTITIARASSAFTHKLTVKIGGSIYLLASDVGTSYAWTPSLSTWGSRVPNSASAKCTMVVDTYNGSTLVGSNEYAFTLSVPATVVPTISAFTTELVNENSVVKGWGIAVKGYTKIKWSITAAGASGSTISKYAFSAGNVTESAMSGTSAALNTAGEITPTATVTDSRGRTATATAAAITVEDYKTPSIRIAKAERCDEDGTINPSGACVKLTFTGEIASVAGKNTVTYQYRSKMANGSYGSWTAFESGAVVTGFATTMSYVIEMRVVDALGKSISTELTITTREEWLHGKEGGKGAAFGKAAEEDNLLDVAWDLRVRGNLILDNPLEGATGVTVVTEAGTNLNDYTKPGWYYFESSYTPTNIPAGSNGWLQVIDTPDHVNSWIKQIWYRSGTPGTNDQQTFVRTKINDNAWGAWARYYTTRDFTMDFSVFRTLAEIGLSGSVTTKQVFDSMPAQSIFIFTNNTGSTDKISDAPTGYCLIELTKDATYGRGQASSVNSSTPTHYISTYYPSGQTFTGWDCIDVVAPAGTECKTAEFWNGKRVYTKLVDLGTVTNGAQVTYHDSTVYPIRYSACTSAGIALPLFMEPALNSTYKAWVDVNTNKITARFASSYSSLRIYCQVWYTKT